MVMLLILYRSVKSRVIKGTCALKIKIATIKGGIIGSAKIFIENECPPIQFRPAKSSVLFKSETAACIAKSRISSVSRPPKRIARPRSGAISPYANPS